MRRGMDTTINSTSEGTDDANEEVEEQREVQPTKDKASNLNSNNR